MWMITTRGFYSVVKNVDDPDGVVVRARAREDLVALADLVREKNIRTVLDSHAITERDIVKSPPHRDYAYRIFMPAPTWHRIALELVAEIDYGNFKDAVKAKGTDGKRRASIYLGVWYRLLSITRRSALDDLDDYGASLYWDPPQPIGAHGPGDDFLVENLAISSRAYNALKRNGYGTIADIQHEGAEGLYRLVNVGDATVEEIRRALDQEGFTLTDSPPVDERIQHER